MHHYIQGGQLAPQVPATIDFPDPTFDAVPHDRATDLAARRDADPRMRRFWGALPKVENHQRAVAPASGSVALQEVRPSPEPLLAAQRLSFGGRGLLRGHGSDSEALTPFSAPPIDDGSTLAGPHPKTKAVGAFPTAIVRLVGSLHGDAAFLIIDCFRCVGKRPSAQVGSRHDSHNSQERNTLLDSTYLVKSRGSMLRRRKKGRGVRRPPALPNYPNRMSQ